MVVKVLGIVAYIITVTLYMRYHIHMFQLNSYKMKESLVWMKKNILSLLGRTITVWIALLLLFLGGSYIKIICIGLLIGTIFLNLPKKAKLALNITMRVKRLICSFYVIYIVLGGGIYYFIEQGMREIYLLGMVLIIPYLVLLANIFNKPIEKSISNYYINDAKNKLATMNDIKVIGITGSYGKTSMKYILSELLSIRYNTLITPGNFNTTLGVVRTIREYLTPVHQIFLCEMGAKNKGDIKEICDLVHPQYGIITSIGPQHLESFKTLDTIINTKFELVDSLEGKGIAFLNYDNTYIKEKEHNKKVISYAVDDKDATIIVKEMTLSEKGATFIIQDKEGIEEEFQTSLIGKHNVLNIVGAISVAYTLGIPLASMKARVKRLKPVAHRLELRRYENMTIIDDAYNSNPMGAKMALDTLSMFEGEKILVTPGMVELGTKEYELNMEFGAQAAQVADYIVLVGKNQSKAILEGMDQENFDRSKVYMASDFSKAMEHVYALGSSKKKIVLLENDLPDNYS